MCGLQKSTLTTSELMLNLRWQAVFTLRPVVVRIFNAKVIITAINLLSLEAPCYRCRVRLESGVLRGTTPFVLAWIFCEHCVVSRSNRCTSRHNKRSGNAHLSVPNLSDLLLGVCRYRAQLELTFRQAFWRAIARRRIRLAATSTYLIPHASDPLIRRW